MEPQFDYVWNFSNDIAEVLVDKETKFINTKGEFIE
ncbi:WG repeat-containing protein [Campylobacter coli]